jgi:hypothetical protein
MKRGFREQVDYDHACRDEGQANECWNVQRLLTPDPGDGGYQDDGQS